MNEVLNAILTRRSVRSYKPDPIPQEALDRILQAGEYAATGMNRQSPIILAVTDKATRDELSRMNAAIMGTDKDPFYGAPTVLVVLARREVPTAVEDGSLTMGSMMLAAESIGLASCWVHRAKETFETEAGRQLLAAWGLDPDAYIGVGNLILGYAAEGGVKPAAARKEGRVVYVK